MTPLLGTDLPVLAAPMAGGPTTPALIRAASGVGSMGFLAAGYLSAAELASRIAEVDGLFGVNVFAPNPVPVDPGEFRSYAYRLQPEAARYGLDLASAKIVEHDDDWSAKIDLLLARPVPVVSFTFALPPASVVAALRRAGTVVLQTVTSTVEARAAADLGVDGLIIQSAAAGAHSGTFTPGNIPTNDDLPDLVRSILAATALPAIAAGGVGTPDDVRAALAAGAQAVMVGTALLRTDESGASAVHKAALAEAANSAAAPAGPAADSGAAPAGPAAGSGAAPAGPAAGSGAAPAGSSVTPAGPAVGSSAAPAGSSVTPAGPAVGSSAAPASPSPAAGSSVAPASSAAGSGHAGDAGRAEGATPQGQPSTVDRSATLLTRAFSGRPARALRNGFTDRHHLAAPSGYPAVHYLTSPLRKAAAQAGDRERVNLWAGTGFRHAAAGPAGAVLVALASKA
ncbi:nitronate monooxygenase [Dactylosporangium sp. CS-047395]|uniref:nitronate monooxygenase n=1 Tax=Dactylosporangium sp. CS-047395 TaxID=3239936 RepID=UPI003D90D183